MTLDDVHQAGAEASHLEREHFGLETPFVAPATETERRLVDLWENLLGIHGLGVEDDYFRLGGDSVAAVALFSEVERIFGQLLLPSSLLDSPTIRSLAALLDRPSGAAIERPLVAVRADGSRPPLFCAHTIFGDVLFVRQFLPFLAPDQPLFGIEARGLDGKDRPHRRFEAMAEDFVQLIRRVQPAGPYFLAGLCDGSLTALEMARLLDAGGQTVAFVALIDPRTSAVEAPWLHWADPDAPMTRLKRQLIRKGERLRRKLGPLVGWRASDDAVAAPVEGPEMQRRRQEIRAGVTEALAAYRPRPFAGSITVFASAARVDSMRGKQPGWGALARRVEIVTVASTHVQVMSGGLAMLGKELRLRLESAQSSARGPSVG